jgi:hypothetical protein
MDYYTVKRLALVLAVQAEIDARKNEIAAQSNPTSDPDFFISKANELRNLAHASDEQL